MTVNFIIEVLSIYLVIETIRVKRRFKLLIQLSLIFICRNRNCFDRARVYCLHKLLLIDLFANFFERSFFVLNFK